MATLLDAIQLHLIVSIPQAFVNWLLIFSFLRPLPARFYSRLLAMVIIHSVCTDILILYIPVYLQLLNTVFWLTLLIFTIFKELDFRKKMFLLLGAISISAVSDMITAGIATAIGITELESLRREHLPELVSILYPQLILLTVAAWFLRRKGTTEPYKVFSGNFKGKRIAIQVLFLITIQLIVLCVIFTVQYAVETNKKLLITILIYGMTAIILYALVMMMRLLTLTHAEAVRSTQALYVDDIQNMFTSVRGQRHDFLNHVQVIHAMAQMGKYEQLQAYTQNLVQETREVTEIIHHASPALAAFAQAKTTVALGRGIAFGCELPSAWDVPDASISMLDTIKILGNLVDNAFDETMRLPPGQRTVQACIRAEQGVLTLIVENRGLPIDPKVSERMFEAGFSTKGDGHSGLGLAIIRERVVHYGGELIFDNKENAGTATFTVRLPYVVPLAG